MLKFITISNYVGNPGQVLNCNGNISTTKVENKQIIICSSGTTYIQEIAYRNNNQIGFLPTGAQSNLYSNAGTDIDRENTWMYATEAESIAGLVANAQIIATSRTEPLILYYIYNNNQVTLYLYDLKNRFTTSVASFAVSSIAGIENCQFLIGGFASAKQQDIFASCSALNVTNAFFNQKNQYQQSDMGISDWCNYDNSATQASIIMLGDFNGDRLSDLFCTNTRYAMINKINSFREIYLVRNTPGNWADQFANKIIAIGDFDNNGASDLASLDEKGDLEILFNNKINNFISYPANQNIDGSFSVNEVVGWCGTTNAQLVVIDADNDGKDDLLCQNNDPSSNQNGAVYLSISRTDPLILPANETLKKIVVDLDEYILGENLGYFITAKNAPLICDASKLQEYFTKISCTLNSANKVDSFTSPVRLSNMVPMMEVNSHIKGSIYLGDAARYGEINLINEEVYDEIAPFSNQPKSKFWKLDSKNFIDPSRSFDTSFATTYIRQGKIQEEKHHLSDQKYSHSVHGGDCNEVNFSYITLVNQFNASGRIEAYDQNNDKIMNTNLLSDLANLYVLSNNYTTKLGTVASVTINNAAGGTISFSFSGEVELQTLYQKNVTQCSIRGIKQTDLLNNGLEESQTANQPQILVDQSSLCLMETDTPLQYINATKSGSTRVSSILTRTDILELDGIIYSGAAFFPDMIVNNTKSGNLDVERYGNNVNDTFCRLNYNNSVILNAYLRGNQYFEQKPHNELMVDFTKNGQAIYEPTRIRFANGTVSSTPAALYAGFDNIKLIKLAAFDPTHILLAWTIYLAEENQYYLLIDYANTGGNLLRIPLYEQYFNLTITDNRLGNEFYVSYRSKPDTYIISSYLAENFALLRSVKVGVDDVSENQQGDSQFILQTENVPATNSTVTIQNNNTNITENTYTAPTSNLVLVRSHNDNKGLFIKKFDVVLNEIGTEANILCDATTANIDTIPTKLDDGYDILRLNFQHNSKIVYHSSDHTYNLNKKIELQNGINLIYRGLEYLKTINSNQDPTTQSEIKTSLENLVCKPTLSYPYLNTAIKSMQILLESDLTYEIHDDTSNSNCKASVSYYPIYRVGNVVHLCPNFDAINTLSECSRLVGLAEITKNFILPNTPTIDATVLTSLLAYFPNDVIAGYTQIINDAAKSSLNSALCDTGSSYNPPINLQTNQVTNNYANNIANYLIAGLVSPNAPQPQVILTDDYNGCFGMVSRGCSISYDKQYNNLCMSYLFEAAATASIITEAANSNVDVQLNCASGCDLDNPALTTLASNAGGYLSSRIGKLFIPKDYSYIFASVGVAINYTSLYPISDAQILTAVPTYFYNRSAALVTFAYLGNDYIDLTAQYFMLNSTTAVGSEQFLGRFLNVAQVQTVAFNETNVLIGYSVKHPTSNNYNIFVQYISASSSQIVNIYPNYNGIFALDIVPSKDASEFMISYTSSDTEITTKCYQVTSNSITAKMQVTEVIPSITASLPSDATIATPALYVNAFLDNTFNIIWSYLNQAGIFIQSYNIFNGDRVGSIENIAVDEASYAQTLRVDADDIGKTVLTWQNQDLIYSKMLVQTSIGTDVNYYSTLNFTASNYSLQDTSIIDAEGDIVSMVLTNANNLVNTIIVNANSSNIVYQDTMLISNNTLVNANTPLAVASAMASSVNISNMLGIIPKALNIDSSSIQCGTNYTIQDVVSQEQSLTTDKVILLSQIVDNLNQVIRQSLPYVNVSDGTIYEMSQIISSSAILQNLLGNQELQNLNLSALPDVDISSQMIALQSNVNSWQRLANSSSSSNKSNVLGDELNNFQSLITQILNVFGVNIDLASIFDQLDALIQNLANLEIPENEEELIEFIATKVKDEIIHLVQITAPALISIIEEL